MEDLGPPAVVGIRTHNLLIDNLHVNIKALNFKQLNQSGVSAFEDHFQLSTFPNPTVLYKILGLQSYHLAIDALKEHEGIKKSCFLITVSDYRLESLMIIEIHKYILKNIHSLY